MKSKIFIFLFVFIALAVSVSAGSVQDLNNTFNYWWSGDSNTDNVTGASCTFSNGATNGQAGGIIGLTWDFDGDNDQADCGNIAAYSTISLSFWINYDGTEGDANDYIVNKDEYRVRMSNSGSNTAGVFMRTSGGNEWVNCNTSMSAGNWYHYVITINDTFSCWVDGALDNRKAMLGTLNTDTNSLKLGGDGTTGADGQMDEIGIYNGILNDSQITALYNSSNAIAYDFAESRPPKTYFLADSGDDSNNCEEGTPCRTIQKLNTLEVLPGDTIRFNRGDTWILPNDTYINLVSGDTNAMVTYADYGTGEKPILSMANRSFSTGDWTEGGTNLWYYNRGSLGRDIGNLDIGGMWGQYNWSTNQVLTGGEGYYYFNEANSSLYVYSVGNPVTTYGYVDLYIGDTIININKNTSVWIENLTLEKGGKHGIEGANANNIVIKNNIIRYIGGEYQSGSYTRYGNGIQFWENSQDNLAEYNTIYEVFDAALSDQGSGNNYLANNITYRHNVIWNSSYCYERFNNDIGSQAGNINYSKNTCYQAGYGWYNPQRVNSAMNGICIRIGDDDSTLSKRNITITDNICQKVTAHETDSYMIRFNDDFIGWNTTNHTWNYNIYDTTADYFTQLGVLGWNTYTFNEWKQVSGFDTNSQQTTVLFTNANAGNFTPIADSPGCGEARDGGDIGALGCSNETVDTTPPLCYPVSITPSDIEADSTGTFELIVNCTDPSGINVSKYGDHYRSFFSMTVDDDGTTPNQWQIYYPANNLCDSDAVISEDILRATGRNENYWYEDVGYPQVELDNYSYAIYDGEYGFFKIQSSGADYAVFNISGPVEKLVFKQSFPLNVEAMQSEVKKDLQVYRNIGLMTEIYDLEAMKQSINYSMTVFMNIDYVGTPDRNIRLYYCNESYRVNNCSGDFSSCQARPNQEGVNCVYVDSFDYTELDTKTFSYKNSEYFKDTFGITDRKIGGVGVTNKSYLYLYSRTLVASGNYTIRYANGSSNTNVSFAESGLSFYSTDNGDSFTPFAGTPDIFINTIKNGDQFQLGGTTCDLAPVPNCYTNFTWYTDDIGDVDFPISNPSISSYGMTDTDLNGTYLGSMSIEVNIAIDPDAPGLVNHSLYLLNPDGSFNFTINNSFYSPDDSDITVYFDTTNVPDGNYKMNVTAKSDEDLTLVRSFLSDNSFEIDNILPTTNTTPVISNLQVNTTNNESLFFWTTDLESNTTICYNYTCFYNSSLTTTHQYLASGLSNGTYYNYTVSSGVWAEAGGYIASESGQFLTTTSDDKPPIYGSPKTNLALIIAIGIAAGLILFFVFKWDTEEHFLLQLLAGFVFVFLLVILAKAAVDSQNTCDLVVDTETLVGNVTSYTYAYECVENPNQTAVTFYKLMSRFAIGYCIYIFLYFLYVLWLKKILEDWKIIPGKK